MDYEKKYKEALERAKDYYEKGYLMINAALEKMFPELNESEDETIRKDIISLVNKWWKEDGAVEQDFSSQVSMIAWLEKQGEKPTLDVEIPFGAKDSELEEVFYSIPNGFHAEVIGDKVVIKKGEQKPAWKPSEEQIGALEHFVRSIAESGFASPYDSNTKFVYSLFNDLKKLKGK